MKVKNLKELLEKCNDEDEVILSKDSEGNEFAPLGSYSEQIYVPETSWNGEIHEKELTEDMIKQGYTKEDLYDGNNGLNAVVLWPI